MIKSLLLAWLAGISLTHVELIWLSIWFLYREVVGSNPLETWFGIHKRDQAQVEPKRSSSLRLFILNLS